MKKITIQTKLNFCRTRCNELLEDIALLETYKDGAKEKADELIQRAREKLRRLAEWEAKLIEERGKLLNREA